MDSRVTGQVDHQTGATDRQMGGQPDGGTEERDLYMVAA